MMRDNNVYITGGMGFIGSNVAKKLFSKNWFNKVIIVDDFCGSPDLRFKSKFQNIKNLFGADFIDREKFINNCPIEAGDVVVHMGAKSSTTNWNVSEIFRLNIDYSKALFEICAKKNAKFIYASSASVYGNEKEDYYEVHPSKRQLHPLNAYAFSKAVFDSWIVSHPAFGSGGNVGLRFFNVFGPGEDHKKNQASVFYNFSKQIQESNCIKIFDTDAKRDFVYIDDVVESVCMCILDEYNGIYDIGSGVARSFNEAASILWKEMMLQNKTTAKQEQYCLLHIPEHIKPYYQHYTKAFPQLDSPNKNPILLEEAVKLYVSNL